ncbi:MAG: hypothetical protein IJ493_04245 [Clostridia bacterium]|nr:hypothetical protein [Clostridia bacterium]
MSRFLSRIMTVKERNRFLLISLLFAAALIIRALSAGAEYLPVLDDSIQYINYPRSPDYAGLIESEGLFASRPLAAIMDLYVVGQMNGCLLIPVLIFAVMHGIAGVLFLRLFDKIWGTGVAFAILYALLPLGVEGTYWLSASSRIVPGLFFAVVAANLLEDFIDQGKWWRAVLFAAAALLSYGFYEQVLVLSFTLTALQFLRRFRERRAWAAALAFPMAAVYFIFTGLHAANGALSSRMDIILPTSAWYFDTFLPDLLRQIGAAFLKGGVLTLVLGFFRGLTVCFGGIGGVICLLASLSVGAGIYFLIPNSMKEKLPAQRIGVWIWGVLLFLAPITPYFIIDSPWFSLRATVPSFIGAGLLIDALLRLILRRERIYAIFCAGIAAVCLIAGISEVNDYHAIGEYDDAVVDEIFDKADQMSG